MLLNKPDIGSFLDGFSKETIDQIIQDKDYCKTKCKQPWDETVSKLSGLIRIIIEQIYYADLNFISKHPFDSSEESIDEFIQRLQSRLTTRFKDSPPFTIYHLVNTLTFNTPGFQIPAKQNDTIEFKGLEKYTKSLNNVISNEQVTIDIENKYFRINTGGNGINNVKLNNIYALKYLRNLEKIIFVQSSVNDVNKNLTDYGSTENDDKNPSKNADEITTNSVQMVKIPWYSNNNENNNKNNNKIDLSERSPKRSYPHNNEVEMESNSLFASKLEGEPDPDSETRTVKRTKSLANMKSELEDNEKIKEENIQLTDPDESDNSIDYDQSM